MSKQATWIAENMVAPNGMPVGMSVLAPQGGTVNDRINGLLSVMHEDSDDAEVAGNAWDQWLTTADGLKWPRSWEKQNTMTRSIMILETRQIRALSRKWQMQQQMLAPLVKQTLAQNLTRSR